jgi:sucrose-6-phosphate hydrolase SacC (GH32 family)
MSRIALLIALLWLPRIHAEPLATGEKFPPELVRFDQYGQGPIFNGGGEGAWDAHIRERGWVMKDGGVWKLWYTGYGPDKDATRQLGYATSDDGIAWKCDPKNPIHRGEWVEDMMVVKDGGKYWMFTEGRNDRAQLLVSEDGVSWKRVGRLDVRKKNGEPITDGPYGTPTAWKEGDVWHLFYERDDAGVWLATSKDLKVWTNLQDKPVLSPGPADFDKDLIALNQVIKHKGRYYAYYHGSAKTGPNARKWSTAVATSTDLIRWEKYPKNPLLPTEENRSSGIVIPDGNKFRLYSMHPAVYLYLPKK